MNHKSIIEIIKYYYEADPFDAGFIPNYVDIAVMNCDYYVRPGRNREMFMHDFEQLMRVKQPKTQKEFFTWSIKMTNLVKKHFDKEYFLSRLEPAEDHSSKRLLKTYLDKFSKKQLMAFMSFVINCRAERDLFLSNKGSVRMWATLNRKCVEKDSSVPSIEGFGYEEFIVRNPWYPFDYLNKKTIAAIFCDHIDKNITLLEKTAKIFYNSGIEAAYNCVNSALSKGQV